MTAVAQLANQELQPGGVEGEVRRGGGREGGREERGKSCSGEVKEEERRGRRERGWGVELELHLAEHPAGHLLLKWLLEQDLTLAEAGKPERFGRILVDTVGTDNLQTWARVNRGAMVLSCLLSSCDASLVQEVKNALKPIIPSWSGAGRATRELTSSWRNSANNQRAHILLEKLC
ncbi:hypothetical protein WMY93_021375 [Mugilogobius chulae]|uniref:Uncharacterized protein n=1 Tax=Mugilogobius chulae TaxID=88201 RepID=A0AAW0NDP1_9GOBI